MINKVKRRVAAELLHTLIDYRATHMMWRISHVWKEGLTPKEYAYLEDCRNKIEEQYKRMSKLQYRLNQSV